MAPVANKNEDRSGRQGYAAHNSRGSCGNEVVMLKG